MENFSKLFLLLAMPSIFLTWNYRRSPIVKILAIAAFTFCAAGAFSLIRESFHLWRTDHGLAELLYARGYFGVVWCYVHIFIKHQSDIFARDEKQHSEKSDTWKIAWPLLGTFAFGLFCIWHWGSEHAYTLIAYALQCASGAWGYYFIGEKTYRKNGSKVLFAISLALLILGIIFTLIGLAKLPIY